MNKFNILFLILLLGFEVLSQTEEQPAETNNGNFGWFGKRNRPSTGNFTVSLNYSPFNRYDLSNLPFHLEPDEALYRRDKNGNDTFEAEVDVRPTWGGNISYFWKDKNGDMKNKVSIMYTYSRLINDLKSTPTYMVRNADRELSELRTNATINFTFLRQSIDLMYSRRFIAYDLFNNKLMIYYGGGISFNIVELQQSTSNQFIETIDQNDFPGILYYDGSNRATITFEEDNQDIGADPFFMALAFNLSTNYMFEFYKNVEIGIGFYFIPKYNITGTHFKNGEQTPSSLNISAGFELTYVIPKYFRF
jgi:hypothetical protein